MKVEKKQFGIYKGKNVSQFVLKNQNGMVVKLMDYGATITSVTIPGKDGKPVSIVCGFDHFEDYFSEDYLANAPYFGCTVGRYCSQIKNAGFSVNGTNYKLAANCGPNNLHGGKEGFDKKIWNAIPMNDSSENELGVLFTLFSPDMDEGFPGNVQASVFVKLTNNNEIVIYYGATTDKLTPFSMTNHSYFNLSGFQENVENFWVKVHSQKLQEMDETGAATGKIIDVSGTIEDLRKSVRIATVHQAIGGFEHFYVFDNTDENHIPVAEIEDKTRGRKLEVFSTEPCMLFYTAKYMSEKLQRNETEKYGKYRAFACETHRWQNGPNIPESPNTFLSPDEKFKSTTIFKLSW